MRILISDQNFGDDAALERGLVDAAGGELVVTACGSEDELADALAEHRPDVLLVQFAPVGVRALEAANGLVGIVRYGVGLDNVDVAAARSAGVAVVPITASMRSRTIRSHFCSPSSAASSTSRPRRAPGAGTFGPPASCADCAGGLSGSSDSAGSRGRSQSVRPGSVCG
jgi:hypothetical protein